MKTNKVLKWIGLFLFVFIVFFISYETIKNDHLTSEDISKTIQKEITLVSNLFRDGTGSTLSQTAPWDVKNITSSEKIIPTVQNIFLEKLTINGNTNNLIEVTGTGKEDIAYINIWWINLTPINSGSGYFIAINKNSFIAGEYFMIINYNDGTIETLNDKLNVIFDNKKVNIVEFNPNTIDNKSDKYITVVGNGFEKVIWVQLNNNVILKKTNYNIINDKIISVLIPAGMEPWEYYLNIMTIDAVYEIKDNYFHITNK